MDILSLKNIKKLKGFKIDVIERGILKHIFILTM